MGSVKLIRKSKVFPYQLLVAYLNAGNDVPPLIKEALQDAMEIALENIPGVDGRVVICPDVSGSMQSSVTGHRKGATSKVRCIDVAALIAAAFLQKNKQATVLPFECDVVKLNLNPRDSVMTNATLLAKVGGGGTNCSAPLRHLNHEEAKVDLVIFVSDNESWADPKQPRGTALMAEWESLRQHNPNARLICIDINPSSNTQAQSRKDILNIGGFSDNVFDLIASFAKGENGTDHWVRQIELQPLHHKKKIA